MITNWFVWVQLIHLSSRINFRLWESSEVPCLTNQYLPGQDFFFPVAWRKPALVPIDCCYLTFLFYDAEIQSQQKSGGSEKRTEREIAHPETKTSDSNILLASPNNKFCEFRIFSLFTFLLIFLWNTFFFEARLERVIDGAADCWSYFWLSKK